MQEVQKVIGEDRDVISDVFDQYCAVDVPDQVRDEGQDIDFGGTAIATESTSMTYPVGA